MGNGTARCPEIACPRLLFWPGSCILGVLYILKAQLSVLLLAVTAGLRTPLYPSSALGTGAWGRAEASTASKLGPKKDEA